MKYPIRIKPTWIQKIICYFRHDITHDTMSMEAYAQRFLYCRRCQKKCGSMKIGGNGNDITRDQTPD